MYRYLFTNDLRVSYLDFALKEAAEKIITETVPTASEDKGANNNINTLSFYFNLINTNNCAKIAAQGNTRQVVLNFIKKFQFPNTRTKESYENAHNDGIKLAPMRMILKLLYLMTMNDRESAYLTKEEIRNFIFYNSECTKNPNINLVKIYDMVIDYRTNGILPHCIERDSSKKQWNHETRQLREMIKILTWSGCVHKSENGRIEIHHEKLSTQNKADIFEIVNFTEYWDSKNTYSKEEKDSYQQYMDISDEEINDIVDTNATYLINNGKNLLIYGVPGCGKSHYIKETYKMTDDNSKRVVFHPDYTYSDLVGQILPQTNDADKTISYEFVLGPFTQLLKECEAKKDQMNYLVIEEINRGNAPAIFGDIFQLLDRNHNGISEYGISNSDIAKEVYGDETKMVKIPNNLTILATMNTADQNVFTLDTAFKRRWEMKAIRNNFKLTEDPKFNSQLKSKLCDSSLDWMTFATAINTKIVEQSESNLGNEDKRLGHFFIKENEMSDVDKFSEKIIMYLWNDVFKYNKSEVFNSEYNTLEDVLDNFQKSEIRFNVFNDNLGFNKLSTVTPQGEGDGNE